MLACLMNSSVLKRNILSEFLASNASFFAIIVSLNNKTLLSIFSNTNQLFVPRRTLPFEICSYKLSCDFCLVSKFGEFFTCFALYISSPHSFTIPSITLIYKLAEKFPSTAIKVMIAVPGVIPCTALPSITETTSSLLLRNRIS